MSKAYLPYGVLPYQNIVRQYCWRPS